MAKSPILLVTGTNRPGSNALRVAEHVRGQYQRANIPVNFYSLSEMPAEIFHPTSYASKPQSWLTVQQRVLDAGGLHIVTPEYNGSFPGVLKYFIDMLKFPESFEGKPVAFTGVAAGIWGGFRAVEQLQMIFGYRNAYLFPDRVFIPGINQKLSPDGKLLDISIDERLNKQAIGFAQFVARFL